VANVLLVPLGENLKIELLLGAVRNRLPEQSAARSAVAVTLIMDATPATNAKKDLIAFGVNQRHSLILSRPTNFQPPLVNSNSKRIGAFSQSFGVSLNGQ